MQPRPADPAAGCWRRFAAALPQEDEELAAAGPVPMDLLVDPGEADADDAAAIQALGDLLGAPLQQQQGAHEAPDHGSQLARPGRGRAAPLLGHALGLLTEVARRAAIAAQLAADGGLVASQVARDLADGNPARVQDADLTALIVLQMAVALSHVGPSRLGPADLRPIHTY